MSYSYDKFLRPITSSDKSIKILDNTNDIKYTIDPFVITNVAVTNNILRISLKSLKVILLDFSTSNEAKIALIRIQEQIDILSNKVPILIDKDIKNYVKTLIDQVETIIGPTGPQGSTGSTGSADRYYATSSTTFEIPALGEYIELSTQPNLAYTAVQNVVIYSELPNLYDYDYEVEGAYFIGEIDNYDPQTGDMSLVTNFSYGSGTYSFWYLNLSGVPGTATSSTLDLTNLTTDIIPAVDSLYSLGSSASQWKSLHVSGHTIYIGGIPLSTEGDSLVVNSINLGTTASPFILSSSNDSLVINGVTGSIGATGADGLQGPIGPTGSVGPRGATGADGQQGPIGPTGSDGQQGPIGPTGSDGQQGPIGATGQQGLGLTFRGTWTSETQYYINDITEFGGSSFTCINDVSGYQPFYTQFWTLSAAIGHQGPTGIDGIQGPTGPTGADGTSINILGSLTDYNAFITGPGSTNADKAGDSWILLSDGSLYTWNGTNWFDAGDLKGPKGDQGEMGNQGPIGPTGAQGIQGSTGPAGPQGSAGASVTLLGSYTNLSSFNLGAGSASGTNQGDSYILLDTGSLYSWSASASIWFNAGDIKGPAGPQGPVGPQGVAGAAGVAGAQGLKGVTGSQGIQGAQGIQGSTGSQGIQGPTGSQGIQGATGATGSQGATGSSGGYLQMTQLLDNVVSNTVYTGSTIVTAWTTSYTSVSGSTLLFNLSFTAYASSTGLRQFDLLVDSNVVASSSFYFNQTNIHSTIPCTFNTETLSAGSHSIQIRIPAGVVVDGQDYAHLSVIETMSNGLPGAQGATGSQGPTGPAGNSVSASYMRGSRSTQQTTGLSSNGLVVFTQNDNSTGSDISLNTSTGQITLAANKTYRLMGQVPTFTTSGGDIRPAFCWYNETASSWVGSESAAYVPSSGAGYGAFGGLSEGLLTTTQSVVVSFRILGTNAGLAGLGGNSDFSTTGSYPWFDIQVISGFSPLLNGATGSTGPQGVTGSTGPAGATGSTGPQGATGPTSVITTLNFTQSNANSVSGVTAAGSIVVSNAITSTGLPIQIIATGDANPTSGNGQWTQLQLYRNSTAIGKIVQVESSNANENVPYALNYIDTPGVGTFTYSVRPVQINGTWQFGEATGNHITLVELGGIQGPTGTNGTSGTSGFAIPAWTSAGVISLTASTTAPVKGTTTQDNIRYRQVGAKEWEIVLTYIQTVASGNSGSGDYLITLPNGLSFDTTLPSQPIYTSNIGTSTWALVPNVIPNGNGTITNLNVGANLFPIVYSSTKFRILTMTYGSGIQCWGSGFYSTGGDNPRIQLSFRFTST